MKLHISPKVRQKLAARHNVEIHEIEQCFCNREYSFLTDTREGNKTNPPTMWFIAETDYGKKLKVIFMVINGDVHIKSTFPPNADELNFYTRCAKKI